MALVTNAGNAQFLNSAIAAALGFNNWHLVNGKYNGCTFCNFAPLPILQGNSIFQEGLNAVAVINQSLGLNLLGSDPNGNGRLFDTVLGVISIQDEYIPQTVVKLLPFAGKANTQRMGGGGYEFKFTLLYIGQDYQKAISNLEEAIKNPPTQENSYLVLQHPTRGIINGVSNLLSWNVNTNVGVYNGAVIQFSVRSEQSNISDSIKTTLTQLVFNAISAALALALAINATIQLIDTVTSDGSNLFGSDSNVQQNSRTTVTTIKRLKVSVNSLTSKLVSNTNYVYKKSRTNVSVSELDKLQVNTAEIPKALNTGNTILGDRNYNSTQGDIIMQYYIEQCETVLDEVYASGLEGEANNLVIQLKESVSALYEVCNLAAQVRNNFAYKVPYDMSLYQALFNNGINFSYAESVMIANPDLPSANYLPQGTVVLL